MRDYIQIINFAVFVVCLITAIQRGWWRPADYWFSVFVMVAHSTLFYLVVLSQDFNLLPHIPTMLWGTGLRLHTGLMVLGYLIFGRERRRRV